MRYLLMVLMLLPVFSFATKQPETIRLKIKFAYTRPDNSGFALNTEVLVASDNDDFINLFPVTEGIQIEVSQRPANEQRFFRFVVRDVLNNTVVSTPQILANFDEESEIEVGEILNGTEETTVKVSLIAHKL